MAELDSIIKKSKEISNDDMYTEESFDALQSEIKSADKSLGSIQSEAELTNLVEALQSATDEPI